MPSNQQQALLECDCGCSGLCPGCCFPLTEDETDFEPIDFCIDAPSCPATDGTCGVFTDEALEPQGKACGSCGSFIWVDGTLTVASGFWNPAGDDINCDFQPGLGLTIRFRLECGDENGLDDNPSLPECCRRLRLFCGTDYETVGWDPTIVLIDFGIYITVIEPETCSCEGGLSAIFSLCRLVPAPKANPSPECGYTPGIEIPECDFCDMTLVI